MRATVVCLLNCVCVAHVLEIPLSSKKICPIKLQIAIIPVNLSNIDQGHLRKVRSLFLILTKLKLLIGEISYQRYFSPLRHI